MALVETYSCPQCGIVNRMETSPPETNQGALKKWVLRGLSWEEAA